MKEQAAIKFAERSQTHTRLAKDFIRVFDEDMNGLYQTLVSA